MDSFGQHQQRRAGRVDDRCFGGMDKLRVDIQRVARFEILHDGRLGADEFGGPVSRAEFVERGIVHPDGVGVDGLALELARHRHDHARVESA